MMLYLVSFFSGHPLLSNHHTAKPWQPLMMYVLQIDSPFLTVAFLPILAFLAFLAFGVRSGDLIALFTLGHIQGVSVRNRRSPLVPCRVSQRVSIHRKKVVPGESWGRGHAVSSLGETSNKSKARRKGAGKRKTVVALAFA